jgi:hypothetical protein
MSVEPRRLAAAQRTAALSARARAVRLVSWLLIIPTLALFSFSVVASAGGYGAKPDYAGAVKAVAPPVHAKKDGAFVVVEAKSKPNPNPLEKLFSHAQHEVCWITSTQLTRVAREYSTGRMTISVDGSWLDLVTVDGANDHDLRAMLGPDGMTCQLVRVSATFFLPFDAHGS